MVGYPEDTLVEIEADGDSQGLVDMEHYGLGTVRTREAYLTLTNIDPVERTCHPMQWCNNGELE